MTEAVYPPEGEFVRVGQAGARVLLRWTDRVLDVGSGHAPHKRATVLLERHPDDDTERSGYDVAPDPRLVIGDAQAMPFADEAFEYVIASHIAEHVEDPLALCRELSRVAVAGYVETPGWLGDQLLREPFHRWRVTRRGIGLRFTPAEPRPLGTLGDAFYALYYAGLDRPGHWTLPIGRLGAVIRYPMAAIMRLPGLRGMFYTQLEWQGTVYATVQPNPSMPKV